MRYINSNFTEIQEGLRLLQEQASAPNARESDIAYHKLVEAIIEGEGFSFMTTNESYNLSKSDMRELLKELLYAIETKRITDRHTHEDIVTETMDNVLCYLA